MLSRNEQPLKRSERRRNLNGRKLRPSEKTRNGRGALLKAAEQKQKTPVVSRNMIERSPKRCVR
jgi:hypothetical protein